MDSLVKEDAGAGAGADPGRLPSIRRVGPGAPFRWLDGALVDLTRAPLPAFLHGLVIALVSAGLALALLRDWGAFWTVALSCGFVLLAPLLAMGPYETGRLLEAGRRPTVGATFLVRRALRGDVVLLGVGLFALFALWLRAAQIVYGLSTFTLHDTPAQLAAFAFGTAEGRTMLAVGSGVGAVFGLVTFSAVVVAAPMLLDARVGVFAAVATSVRATIANFWPLMLWAALIVALVALCAVTGFLPMVIVFPWLGLASWRAYRDIVAADGMLAPEAGLPADGGPDPAPTAP
ncbi:MAG: DUF2189 domain-containing protein [Phenylobacterium sp.]|uniref:DUF2189 domain-containing protein n=1 Tax=Phenylobacterium sp. TaxID=1871053 RepID=UPI0025ECD44F|nr:DUF2189 domain-containing protein [Phenylobacterium sp.]MCA3723875.1 DUF2189 domain-containing protein [Phenylobacterium sp.]MCA6334593.1 DUF2189 domain-containing protein [Phenylobacterium sp.]